MHEGPRAAMSVAGARLTNRGRSNTMDGMYAAAPKAGSVHHMKHTAATLMLLLGDRSLPTFQ